MGKQRCQMVLKIAGVFFFESWGQKNCVNRNENGTY